MIASTSHDMKTPLNTILTMNRILYAKIKNEENLKLIKTCNDSSKLLLSLVNDSLDFFQIRSKKFDMNNEYFMMSDVVNSCFDLFSI